MRKIFLWWLRQSAKLAVWRFRPAIVVVTGSAGKSMVKNAAGEILSRRFAVRTTPEKFPGRFTEAMFPVTFLRAWPDADLAAFSASPGIGAKFRRWKIWFSLFLNSLRAVFPLRLSYPSVVILEAGLERPHAIRDLLLLARPDAAVVTNLSDPPPHAEHWEDKNAVAREKSYLVESLPASGMAILNRDDPAVFSMREKTRARIMTFGFAQDAAVRILALENHFADGHFGIAFKLEYAGAAVPVFMHGVFGRACAYAAASAACIGLTFHSNLSEIAELLGEMKYAAGLGAQAAPGIKQTILLDASSHASPASVREGLEVLYAFPGKRKIAVLGDMSSLGKYSIKAHAEAGNLAARVDTLLTVGPHGKFIRDAAEQAGLSAHLIHGFDTAQSAGLALQALMQKGDVVLIAGAKGTGLEKVVFEVKDQTGNPAEKLVQVA